MATTGIKVATLAIGLFIISTHAAHAQACAVNQWGLVVCAYNGANAAYQYEMQRQGRPAPWIGSPQFFRNNFPPPQWDDFSRSTSGIIVRPRNCWGPYC